MTYLLDLVDCTIVMRGRTHLPAPIGNHAMSV